MNFGEGQMKNPNFADHLTWNGPFNNHQSEKSYYGVEVGEYW